MNVVNVNRCESCEKLFRVTELKLYKFRKGTKMLYLCPGCYEDFTIAEEYVKAKYEK